MLPPDCSPMAADRRGRFRVYFCRASGEVPGQFMTHCMVRPCVARVFVELAVSGLASMYPAFDWSACSGPPWISLRARAISLASRPRTGPFGSPVLACAGKTRTSISSHSLADLAAGKSFNCSHRPKRLTPRPASPRKLAHERERSRRCGPVCFGKRNRQHVAMQPFSLAASIQGLSPWRLPALGLDQHDPGRLHEQDAQVADCRAWISCPGWCGLQSMSAWEQGRARRRSPAPSRTPRRGQSRPLIALEMIGPMPGTLISRSQSASWRATASISPDRLSTRSSSRRQSLARSSMTRTMRGDSTSGGVARTRGNSTRKNRRPCRTATPRSSRKARI